MGLLAVSCFNLINQSIDGFRHWELAQCQNTDTSIARLLAFMNVHEVFVRFLYRLPTELICCETLSGLPMYRVVNNEKSL